MPGDESRRSVSDVLTSCLPGSSLCDSRPEQPGPSASQCLNCDRHRIVADDVLELLKGDFSGTRDSFRIAGHPPATAMIGTQDFSRALAGRLGGDPRPCLNSSMEDTDSARAKRIEHTIPAGLLENRRVRVLVVGLEGRDLAERHHSRCFDRHTGEEKQ